MKWYLALHSANMCLLLCLEPLPPGWFVGNSEQVQVPSKSKVTVLNHVGWVAEVQPHPFLRREGKCQLCSPLSSARVPGQSCSIWQSSLLKMELYHIQVEPQERTVAIGPSQIPALFLEATGFTPFWEAALPPLCRPGVGKANDDSLQATHPSPAHPPPLAWPLNETFTQQHNLAEAKYFSSFPSKLLPNLTAELQAPQSTAGIECCKSEIILAANWDFRPVPFFKLAWHLSLH